jgi:hypothetical protein
MLLMLRLLLIGLGILAAAAIIQLIHFSVVTVRSDQQTNDGRYFAMPRADRAAFRARLRRHTWLLAPLIWVISRILTVRLKNATFHHQGVPGPKGACDERSFARGAQYRPSADDVFVVTPMKCGTTWMQNLVYQLATRGSHDLSVTGTALYHLAPWLESRKTIPAEQGPLIGGPHPVRLIKTHFPSSLCPFDEAAKYIYVVRHPVSCFASCVDFLRSNLGRMTPSLEACEEWFCSPEIMWWSPWPQHVSGWWQRAQTSENVLFIRYEDMKQDLRTVADRVQSFLGMPQLNDEEMADVLQHCSFEWMSRNFDLFEMQVPHLLQDASDFFKSGRMDRYRDIPQSISERMVAWCDEQLEHEGLSTSQWYDTSERALA